MVKWNWREHFKPVVPDLKSCIKDNLLNLDAFYQGEDAEVFSTLVCVHGKCLTFLFEQNPALSSIPRSLSMNMAHEKGKFLKAEQMFP